MSLLRHFLTIWLLASTCQAAHPHWAQWCTHLFGRVGKSVSRIQPRAVEQPFLYKIEKDGVASILFVTPPVPLSLGKLPPQVLKLFFEAQEWVGDEFSTRDMHRQLQLVREQKKTEFKTVSLAQELSEEAKSKLTSIVIENLKADRSPTQRWLGYLADAEWRYNAMMPEEQKRIFIREHLEPLSAGEAYLEIWDFENRQMLSTYESRRVEEQLTDLARSQKTKLRVLSLTPPHKQWRFLERQLSLVTIQDLEQSLSSLNLRSNLLEAYYQGDQEWAHRECDRRRDMESKLASAMSLQRLILAASIAKHHAQTTQKRIYLIKAQDAFGTTGLLSRLKRHRFRISRLVYQPD